MSKQNFDHGSKNVTHDLYTISQDQRIIAKISLEKIILENISLASGLGDLPSRRARQILWFFEDFPGKFREFFRFKHDQELDSSYFNLIGEQRND